MANVKLKKGDEVVVISGRSKNTEKTHRILKVMKAENRAIVEGVNKIKRHRKADRKDPHGGIKEEDGPIHMSNLMLVCPTCKKITRVGIKLMENQERVRICKKCGAVVEKK